MNIELTVREKAENLKERYRRMNQLKDQTADTKEIYEKVKAEVNQFILQNPDYKDFF